VRDAGFDVTAPLLPGHGTTPRDLQDRTFDDWLGAAREAFHAVRRAHDAVAVLGFSMGSLLALSLAAGAETRDAVSGVVVLGCALRMTAPLRAVFGLASAARVPLPDAYVPKPFGPDLRDPTLAESIQAYDRHPVRAAMQVHRAGPAVAAHLDAIRCPVLALHGARDRVCSPRASRELEDALGTRDVRVRIYPRSGHLLALDFDREDVAADVVRFLERVRARKDDQLRPVEP
jgi:carboxylesterase